MKLHLKKVQRKIRVAWKGRRGLANIEDCMDAGTRGHEECTNKSKERFITAASNSKNKE